MASYRLALHTPVDGLLPADRMQVTPHVDDLGTSPNFQAVVDAAAANVVTYLRTNYEVTATIYRDVKTKPNYPLATKTVNSGTAVTSTWPRELALCLSYYATHNRPRSRGRLYIPGEWIAKHLTTPGSADPRPTAAQITAAKEFATVVLIPLTSTGVKWTVYSPTEDDSFTVTNYWVDDEWDIIRSRGRKGTTRQLGTIP